MGCYGSLCDYVYYKLLASNFLLKITLMKTSSSLRSEEVNINKHLYSSVPLYILAACIPFLQHSVHPRFNVLLYALRTKLRTWTHYSWNVDRLQFVMVGIFNSCLLILFPYIYIWRFVIFNVCAIVWLLLQGSHLSNEDLSFGPVVEKANGAFVLL